MARRDDRITALEHQVAGLKSQVEESKRVQGAALRRLNFLPRGIQDLLEAEHVSAGVVSSDQTGMTFEVGNVMQLTIYPFRDQFTIADATNRMRPRTFKFGVETDFTDAMVLEVVGYYQLAQRPDGVADVGNWVERLGQPALT